MNVTEAVGRANFVRMVRGFMDLLVAAVVFVAAEALAGWGWSVAELAALFSGWACVRGLAIYMSGRGMRQVSVTELAAAALVLVMASAFRTSDAGTYAQLLYGLVLVLVVQVGWRHWCRRNDAVIRYPIFEPVRVLLVAAAGLWVLSPMLTDRFTGGTDARWYAYMLHDFIQQWRTHGPPVFLGQGELVWVGSVHPFRSAPVYMHLAGLWDWVTCGALGIGALQHLTVITAVLAGGWGVYATGVTLAPRCRWESAAIAALYAMSPAVLATLYLADAYMTYLAAAACVWVLYGNVRILTDRQGWIHLAGGLSLVWMCHPPTAMQVTLLSAVLQMGGMACGAVTLTEWRKVIGAGSVFALLSLYYFVGMSELPRSEEMALGADLLQVMAMPLGWFAAVRVFAMKRSWWWLLLLVPVTGILWLTCRPWLGWLGLTLVLLGILTMVSRRWVGLNFAGHAPLLLLICVLVGAAGMDVMIRAGWASIDSYPEQSRQLWTSNWSENYFKPLILGLRSDGVFQPGWGLWLAGLGTGLAACRRGALATQFVFGALLLVLLPLVHWPRVGDFMFEYFPRNLTTLTGITMEFRVAPVLASLLALGGLLALRELPGLAVPMRRLAVLILLLAVVWASWQGRYFVHRGHFITTSPELSAKDWRSENAPMDRFVYDLLPIPSYFSHGKMDPRMEMRLLDNSGNLIYGPAQMMKAMEEAGTETVRLVTRTIPGHPDWLQIEPGFVLQPGEHRLLRFEFDPARSYSGYLIMTSPGGYREYRLPESGMQRSFGTGPDHSRGLSLWNSGAEPEHYMMQFLLKPGHDLAPDMHFATMVMSMFRPERLLIRLESINPWRVWINLPREGKLETPRVFLPGYEVWMDGHRLARSRISVSPDRLLQIAMPPGEHTVEVRFVGTLKLRMAGVVSLLAWIILLAWLTGVRPPPSLAGRFWTSSARMGDSLSKQ